MLNLLLFRAPQSSSKLLVVSSLILFLVVKFPLLLVCNSFYFQFELLLFLVGSSFYSWATSPSVPGQNSSCFWFVIPFVVVCSSSYSWSLALLSFGPTLFALGLQFFLILVGFPLAPSSQLLLLLVYNSFWSWSKLFLVLVGNSSYSQLVALLPLGWQILLLLGSSSSCSQSLTFLGHGRAPLTLGLQVFLLLVRTPFAHGWQLFLLLVGSFSCSWWQFFLFLVCNFSWSWSKLLLFLIGNSSCSQSLTLLGLSLTPIILGLQLFLFLVRNSFCFQSTTFLTPSLDCLAFGLQFFLFLFTTTLTIATLIAPLGVESFCCMFYFVVTFTCC